MLIIGDLDLDLTCPLLIITPNIDLDLDYTSFDRLLFLILTDFRLGKLTVYENVSFYFELSLFSCKSK